jgi:hypothetical protein
VFDQFQRTETQHGVLGEVVFRGTSIERARVIPLDIVRTAPRLSAVQKPE